MTHPLNSKVLMKNTKSSFKNGLSILSHTAWHAQWSGDCRQETDGDLKNGLPSVCFYFTHFDSILKVKLNIFVFAISKKLSGIIFLRLYFKNNKPSPVTSLQISVSLVT